MTKIIESLGLEAIHFVASIKVIEAGNILETIDFTTSNELKLSAENTVRRRGRPKLTETQKAFSQFKRSAGQTKKFSRGEEPNRRSHFD